MVSVITNTVSLYLLWKIVEPYAKNPWLFSWLYFSFVIFHVFGFIVTPDSPLLFFSVLYLYFLSNYIKQERLEWTTVLDRKSTRLNSSHVKISYAVFCLKKKK